MVRIRDIFFKKKEKPVKEPEKPKPIKPKKKLSIKPFFKKKGVITILGLMLFIGLLFYLGATPFNICKTESCFDDALKTCSPLKYEKYQNSNLYIYRIFRSVGSKCKITITLNKMAIGADRDLIELLEGKSMFCTIPKTDPEAIKKLNFCHGELKEGLQQVLIQRVYGLLIKDIPDILEKAV